MSTVRVRRLYRNIVVMGEEVLWKGKFDACDDIVNSYQEKK